MFSNRSVYLLPLWHVAFSVRSYATIIGTSCLAFYIIIIYLLPCWSRKMENKSSCLKYLLATEQKFDKDGGSEREGRGLTTVKMLLTLVNTTTVGSSRRNFAPIYHLGWSNPGSNSYRDVPISDCVSAAVRGITILQLRIFPSRLEIN